MTGFAGRRRSFRRDHYRSDRLRSEPSAPGRSGAPGVLRPVHYRWSSCTGDVPGSAPEPLQCEQVSSRWNSISFSTPKTASSNVSVTCICKSRPRRGERRERRPVEKPNSAEQFFEDIAKVRGVIVEAAAHIAKAFLAKAVIAGALFRIGEHAVGFVDLFELFLGIRPLCSHRDDTGARAYGTQL